LLGFLLTLFLATFLYVAYLFLTWGQTAVAQLPRLPPLALPQLVRPAPANAAAARAPAGVLWQPAPQQTPGVEPLPSGRITVLVMGVDNRPDEPVARTDSIILLTMNPRAGSAGMLSLPRDLWVPVPALGRSVKINTVHVLGEINKFPGGGPGLLRDTISEFLGYPVDYYVRLNFDGFRQIVDLIGGIDIDVPKEIRDDTYPDEHYGFDPLYIPAGRQHMDGALALKYARTRHVDSDYGRARRQQQVIVAIKDKVTQPGQLAALLPRLPGLMLALANSVQTDMPMDKVISLTRMIDRVDLNNPTRVVVDGSMGATTTDPTYGYILVPDMNKVRVAAAAVFADATDEPSAAEVARQQLRAEAGRIVVKNGSQEEGLAAKTAAALSADGFNVVAVGNADRADYAQTWLITYGDAAPVAREALVVRFGIPPDRIRSEPSSDQADLTLILGADQAQR
jgi:LCP family protein required for cell wall assembly